MSELSVGAMTRMTTKLRTSMTIRNTLEKAVAMPYWPRPNSLKMVV